MARAASSQHEKDKILTLFTQHHTLKFAQIEKMLGIRSNKLSYDIDLLKREGLLEKNGEYYMLTTDGERSLPLYGSDKSYQGPMAVILVAVEDKGKLLLLERKIRPYKGYWGLIGGKLLAEEDVKDAVTRLVKTKTGYDAKLCEVAALVHEKVYDNAADNQNLKHSFLLIVCKATLSGTAHAKTTTHARWLTRKQQDKENIIPSDKWIIESKLHSSIPFTSISMDESAGILHNFSVKK